MERRHCWAWLEGDTLHFRFWAEGRWQKLVGPAGERTWEPAELTEAELQEAEAQKAAEEAAAQDPERQQRYAELRRQVEAQLSDWRPPRA